MTLHPTRRQVLQATAAAGAGFWLGVKPGSSRAENSPNEKLNIAFVGLGGMGSSNLNGIDRTNQNVVALCDVDDVRAGKAYENHKSAKKFYDYRKMFDSMANEIDAVVVSTPDHSHFHPSMMAMNLGKHLYSEKPMAHNVWEIRTMTDLARKKKLATQLGVQRHAIPNMARIAEMIQAGAIGDVSEVHCRVGGERGMPKMPTGTPPVPNSLKWDLWIGPAKERSYTPEICPYKWRFYWDYGTGEMGNWGCHILDIPFRALRLDAPTSVVASGPEVDEVRTPKTMSTQFEFPARGDRPAVKLHWHHTKEPMAILKEHGIDGKGVNTVFVGADGVLACGFNTLKLYPEEKFADHQSPEQTIAKSPGFRLEWVNACKGGEAATCNFDYSGPLSEAVLLSNVAYRSGAGFDWDSENMKAVGNEKAQNLLREEYRKGWEIA